MATKKQAKRGVKYYRTVKVAPNKYIHVAIVKKKGKRGGTTVAGKVHTKKRRA